MSPTPNVSAAVNDTAEDDQIDLMGLIAVFWRRKWILLFLAFIGAALGIYQAFERSVPVYTASTTVVLESNQQSIVDIEAVVSGISGDQYSINTEVEILRSRALIEKLVDTLNLMADPEFNASLRDVPQFTLRSIINSALGSNAVSQQRNEDQIKQTVISNVRSRIAVSIVRQSFVFRIDATTTSPQKSALIANTLAELYVREQINVKLQGTENAIAWLSNRAAELQVELEAAEEEARDFAANSDLISSEALAALTLQVKDLRDLDIELSIRIARLQTEYNERVRHRDAQAWDALAALYNDALLNSLLDAAKAGTEASQTAFLERFDTLLQASAVEIARMEIQRTTLDRSIQDLESQVADQSSDLVVLQQLTREAEASRLIYEFFLSRLKEISVQEGTQTADSRLLSEAAVPRSPSAPRKSLIVILCTILGGMVGAALVLYLEFSDNRVRTAEQIVSLTTLPVLGKIPKIKSKNRASVVQYLRDRPSSQTVEAIRNLRTSILMIDPKNPPKVIMSTSSNPSEGKTTQSLALAQNFAGLGKNVLLIEGDVRRKVLSQYFNSDVEHGLVSVLEGNATLTDAAIFTDDLGCDILFADDTTRNVADVLSSSSFKKLLDDARDEYEIVIVDTAPVLVVPDALIIGAHVNQIIYTVKWNTTTKRQLVEGIQSLRLVNLPVAGIVLGQIDVKAAKKYGDYGAYGAYGGKYYTN